MISSLGKGGEDDNGESYDQLDSFLNSLEVSNVLSKTSSISMQDTSKAPKSSSGGTKSASSSSSTMKSASSDMDSTVEPSVSGSDPSEAVTKKSTSSSDGVKKKKKVVSESTSDETPPYADMTVSALKDRCRSIGLPVGGTKAELLSRLTDR